MAALRESNAENEESLADCLTSLGQEEAKVGHLCHWALFIFATCFLGVSGNKENEESLADCLTSLGEEEAKVL